VCTRAVLCDIVGRPRPTWASNTSVVGLHFPHVTRHRCMYNFVVFVIVSDHIGDCIQWNYKIGGQRAQNLSATPCKIILSVEHDIYS